MFQVNHNHSTEEEIDVERIDVHPPSNLSASDDDIIIVPDGIEDSTMTEGVHVDDATINRSSIASKLVSLLVNKKTAIAATTVMLLCAGAMIGVSINGAAENKQQKALAAINSIDGKAGKGKAGKSTSTSFCEPVAQVTACGETFTESVVLSSDLFCTGDVDGATKEELKTMNAAIKLEGPDAIIDCKGHTVRQVAVDFGRSAVYCNSKPGFDLNPRRQRKLMKENCELYFQAGIWLANGATAINCKVEQFYDGFFVQDGGEVKESEVSRSYRGILIQDEDDSGSDLSSKISDV